MAKMRKLDVMISEDRISELPKNLIESILERISINEAARTSILSTKWRYIWTNITKLVLDEQFFEGLTPNKRTDSSQFVQVVDAILMLHNGPIQEFNIYIPFSQTPNMDLWILYLSKNGVKDLTISNNYHYYQSYKLPSYIFSCDQLTYLSLYNCVLNTPFQFTGFGNLRNLVLEITVLSTNTGSLISKLVFLDYMSLLSCHGVENINSLPPNLSCLSLVDCHEVQWQWFQSKTKISDLCIRLCKNVKNVDVQGKIVKLNSLLSNLPNLSILRLDEFALKFLAAGGFSEIPHLSHKLKEIRLILRFDDLDQVLCAFRLLKSSPNLEKLEIVASFLTNDSLEQHELSDIVNIADSDLILNHLQSATLAFFNGYKAELAFVKLILSRSPTLQQMEIECEYEMDADKELPILMQMMRFRRASVESEIIYTRGQIN